MAYTYVSQSVDYELHHTNYQFAKSFRIQSSVGAQSVIQSTNNQSAGCGPGVLFTHTRRTRWHFVSPHRLTKRFGKLFNGIKSLAENMNNQDKKLPPLFPARCPETNWCISRLQHFSSLHLVSNRSIRQRFTMSLDVAGKSFVHPSDGQARWQQDERRTPESASGVRDATKIIHPIKLWLSVPRPQCSSHVWNNRMVC